MLVLFVSFWVFRVFLASTSVQLEGRACSPAGREDMNGMRRPRGPRGRCPPAGQEARAPAAPAKKNLSRKTSPERPLGSAEPGWFSLRSRSRHWGCFPGRAGPRLLPRGRAAAAGVMLPKSDLCGAGGDGHRVQGHLTVLPSLPSA